MRPRAGPRPRPSGRRRALSRPARRTDVATTPNLAAAREAGLRFISRLRETYGLARTVKERAWAGAWAEVGKVAARDQAASYMASEQGAEIDGHPYRLVVFRSSRLDRRKAASFEKELQAQREETSTVMAPVRAAAASNALAARLAYPSAAMIAMSPLEPCRLHAR